MNVPENLQYAESHEWLAADGTVGITDHAQHELTDVVFVELPKIGAQIEAGATCAVVESVKAASDIYAPASGEVVAVNDALADNPALVNTDPYGNGWLFKMKVAAANPALKDAAAYRAQIA
jgi:glycine cleavage system H protein